MISTLAAYAQARNLPFALTPINLSAIRSGACRPGRACSEPLWGFSDTRPLCLDCPQVRWLTMMREPMSRLKSAFYYCEGGRYKDTGVCGGMADLPRPSPQRECEFGRRWGNYQLQRLVGPAFDATGALPCAAGLRCAEAHWPCRREVLRRCGLDGNASAAGRFLKLEALDRLSAMLAVGLAARSGFIHPGLPLTLAAHPQPIAHAVELIGLVVLSPSPL